MPAQDPYTARDLLSDLLRMARVASGHPTQEALAPLVGIERSGIARAENRHPPTRQVLDSWLAHCGVQGLAAEAVRGVWRLARRGEDPAEKVQPWHETVARAHTVRYWQQAIFPGVVQCLSYAAEIYLADGYSPEEAERLARARVERQSVLDSDDAPTFVLVLWQPVLYHQIGAAEVMAAQCRRLLEVSQRRNVVCHVVKGACAGLGGSVCIASVHGEADVLLAASMLEDSVTSRAAELRAASSIFERVRSVAASVTESTSIITEAHQVWTSRQQ